MGDAGVLEWASLAMLGAIDFADELRKMRNDEADRRRAAVREALVAWIEGSRRMRSAEDHKESPKHLVSRAPHATIQPILAQR